MNSQRLGALSARLRHYTGTFSLRGWNRCACGIACDMPEFKMVGLGSIATKGCLRPRYEGKQDWEAVMAFFDLTYDLRFNLRPGM